MKLDDQTRRAVDRAWNCRLITVGRKSGEPRRVTIWFALDGDEVVLAGGPDGPHWYRNLKACEDVELQVGRYRLHGLNETHVVSLRNGRLRIEIPGPLRNLVWGDLTPVAGDLFVAPVEGEPSCTNVTVKFLRNDRGAVAALSYSINRCRDIVFRKQNDVRSDDESG